MKHDDETSEGEYLSALLDSMESEPLEDRIAAMQKRYNHAELAKAGDRIQCPCCGKGQTKTTYHHKFCTGRNSQCRNEYHNLVPDDRRERARMFAKTF